MKNTRHQYLNFDFAKQVPWNCWSIFWNTVLYELFWILNCSVVYATTRKKAIFCVKKTRNLVFCFCWYFYGAQCFRNIFCAAVKKRNKTVMVKFWHLCREHQCCYVTVATAKYLKKAYKNKFGGGKLKYVNSRWRVWMWSKQAVKNLHHFPIEKASFD